MDFVEWCSFVLEKLVEATLTSPEAKIIGVDEDDLSETIFSQRYYTPKQHEGILDALRELKRFNLVESPSSFWKVTKPGRELTKNKDWSSLWQLICQEKLEAEEEQLLKVVNKLSAHSAEDHAWLEEVNHELVLAGLGWPDGTNSLHSVSQELEQLGLIRCQRFIGQHIEFLATYSGLVWETRRKFTVEAKFIDALVAEWETTSVEFKQYLYLTTVEQKAEFIKDVLSLANTQASGRRWMIIGFHNKTHEYSGLPHSDLHQDDLERLVAEYTDPHVDVRYEVVEYSKGPVGKLEVIRDPKKVPYRVAKSLSDKLKGDKKRIIEGQIFVRHGSQVEEPTEAERKALQEEGDQARLKP